MIKFLFAILLIFAIYIYASVTPVGRADINHSVGMIPYKMGQALESAANKITDIEQDYHTEQGD